jgi:lipopolysaccharide export system permease protein
LALNKSRLLLSKDGFNSFLPTIRVQQFSDSFKGFSFIVEEKYQNEIKNVFIHDSSNTLKNLSSKNKNTESMTIVAQEGIVEEKKMMLFKGQIISSGEKGTKDEIIDFNQLNIDLQDLQTDTIKVPKLQETSTIQLINCLAGLPSKQLIKCNSDTKKEIKTMLNRRIILPFYIPVISLLCSFLLIKTNTKKNKFINTYSVFGLSFLILLYAELIIRFTGISKLIGIIFLISPLVLIPITYTFLMFKFSKESSN